MIQGYQMAPGHIQYVVGDRVFDSRYGVIRPYPGRVWSLTEDGRVPPEFRVPGHMYFVTRSKQAMHAAIERRLRPQQGD